MREMKRISVNDAERDADQPRKLFDEQELLALGQNMLAHMQQVPVIVYCPEIAAADKDTKKYRLLDGERRWRACQLVGISELDAIVLSERPTQTALHILQMSLEAHRQSLTPMERSNLLHRIRTENSWQISELAENLHMKQPLVSKLLSFQKLDPTIQHLLHTGGLDIEKGQIVSQEPDLEKQRALAKAATKLTREQLRQKAKGTGASTAKSASARFPLAEGLVVTVQGRELTLPAAIEAMMDTVRELKRGLAQGLDISTAQRVMRDRARARP